MLNIVINDIRIKPKSIYVKPLYDYGNILIHVIIYQRISK